MQKKCINICIFKFYILFEITLNFMYTACTLLLFASLPPSYDHSVPTMIYGKETLRWMRSKLFLLSNKIMERPFPEEETASRLATKERVSFQSQGANKS